MAWPPPIQPNTFANETLQVDAHPLAHNDIANTLNLDFAPQVSANLAATETNATDISTLQGNFRTGNTGAIRGTGQPYLQDGAGTDQSRIYGAKSRVWITAGVTQSLSTSGTTITNTTQTLVSGTTRDGFIILNGRADLLANVSVAAAAFIYFEMSVNSGAWATVPNSSPAIVSASGTGGTVIDNVRSTAACDGIIEFTAGQSIRVRMRGFEENTQAQSYDWTGYSAQVWV